MGYINAPAIWQLVVAQVPEATVDVSLHPGKRDELGDALNAMGYNRPAAARFVLRVLENPYSG